MQRAKLSKSQSGISGEYFVAAELSRRGYVATLTQRTTRGIDILVANADATKSCGIQVKTTQGGFNSWLIGKKDCEGSRLASTLVFVFVSMYGLDSPKYYVVPRRAVARYAKRNHKAWLARPGRGGRPHKDNPMRKFADIEGTYLGAWQKLGLD